MGKGDFRDFDAMLAEMEGETLCFQLFGRRYRMKKRLPAAIVLKLARAEPDQRVEAELLAQAARALLGQKQFDELMANEDFSMDLMGEILKWAFQKIDGDPDGGEPSDGWPGDGGPGEGGAVTEDGPRDGWTDDGGPGDGWPGDGWPGDVKKN